MSPEDRAWLAGILEGLAGREVDPRLIERIVSRCAGPARRPAPVREPTPAAYGDYDGPGAPPLPEDEAVAAAMPAKSIEEMKAQLAAAPAKRRGKKASENTTPVAEKPPYTPDDPTVVRLA